MESFGYPHEVIALAQRKKHEILTGNYEARLKAWAGVYARLDDMAVRHKSPLPRDPLSVVVWALAYAPNSLRKTILSARIHVRSIASQYEQTKSDPIYQLLSRKLPEIILLHIVSQEFKQPLLNRGVYLALRLITHSPEMLALGVYEGWEDISTDDLIKKFSGQSGSFNPEGIALSLKLSEKFKENKADLLRKHYQLLASAVEHFPDHLDNPHLDDVALEALYKLSVALVVCGYSKSMRIPRQESINYLADAVGHPTSTTVIEEAYQSSASIYGVPLWLWIGFGVLLVIWHWLHEFWLPASITLPGGILSVDLGFNIPLLLVFALVVFAYVGFRMFKLKSSIKSWVKRNA